jgi:putative transposase
VQYSYYKRLASYKESPKEIRYTVSPFRGIRMKSPPRGFHWRKPPSPRGGGLKKIFYTGCPMKNHAQKIDFNQELLKCKTMDDLCGKNGLLQKLLGGMVEQILEGEMEEHIGYAKHASSGNNSGNSRNGTSSKKVNSSYGPVDIDVPRDRNSEFEPQLIKKRQRSISAFDDKIISMYAKGMSTRDIQTHVQELYGAEISPTAVSNITEKVLETAKEWQSRPLQKIYPITYFDAIHYKVREGGKVLTKAAYTCLGVDLEGRKEVLGLWIGESEGAKFWLKVFSELKNRGVQDIFIACVDGLKGLPDAIHAIFPETEIQLCIIHMIRNSFKYVPDKHVKEFISDLKLIYRAETEEKAEDNLYKLQVKWEEKYPLAVRPWVNNWENIKTYFKFPQEIRTVIYTTNAVESLHRQFRKVTKNRSVLPTDESLFKLLYLTVAGLSSKWTMPLQGWKSAISQFVILYEDRLQIDAV